MGAKPRAAVGGVLVGESAGHGGGRRKRESRAVDSG